MMSLGIGLMMMMIRKLSLVGSVDFSGSADGSKTPLKGKHD